MFYVYLIRSLKDGSLYKGQTRDIPSRLKDHNRGKCKFTSSKTPWEVVYFEHYPTREEALAREKFLKSAAGRRFLQRTIPTFVVPESF